ncbi:Probable protein phosphatase 2C 4 [Linum grandiflorum]
MGNGIGKLTVCFTGGGGGDARRRHDLSLLISDPLDEGLGHSFCYVRPDPARLSSSKVHHSNNSNSATAAEQESTTFRTISGASISANTSTPLSTAFVDPYVYNTFDRAAAFESSTSFASIPLQPIPRNLIGGGSNSVYSGPLPGQYSGLIIPGSGPMERGFMSGPIERGFMSGPLDNRAGLFSGPMEKSGSDPDRLHRSFSYGGFAFKPRSRKRSLIRVLQRAISKTRAYSRRGQNSMVAPIKNGSLMKEHSQPDWILSSSEKQQNENLTVSSSGDGSLGEEGDSDSLQQQNLQWAQGKAGEDRVHVVVSDEHGWVFVGIYDGFNGPDAPDFLVSNLYSAVHKELKGLLWDDDTDKTDSVQICDDGNSIELREERFACVNVDSNDDDDHPCVSKDESFDSKRRRGGKNSKGRYRGVSKKWEENQRRWKSEWDKERLELDRRLKEQLKNQSKSGSGNPINHGDVLKALSQALRKTEESYLGITDMMLMENPELALMGSCVLVMLMKGEDVYVLNVGDSRAVLAQKAEPDYGLGRVRQDLERINEETLHDLEGLSDEEEETSNALQNLTAVQLTIDHSTSAEEEVQRIRSEHPDDPCAVMNDRVKGSLKVTRAFGAGFLKQAKWNDALLEMFRIDYIGNSPYINCVPSLYHHRLGAKDRFLILCSDGLYQYLTNEEAVSEVEFFIAMQPEGDPAQHLVEEVMFRAAKKAGMDFHELLEIPQGDRRRYHDDVSIIVISLEGRIWRSFV